MDLTDCDLWDGRLNADGYGTIGSKLAHRVAYEREVGPIPEGCELDHLCSQRACVNVKHLEPVSRRVNIDRSDVGRFNRAKTMCPHGHPLDAVQPNGSRYCRACKRAATRRWRARKKESAWI